MAQQFHTIHLYNSTLIVKTSFFEIFLFYSIEPRRILMLLYVLTILPQFFSGILEFRGQYYVKSFEKSSSNAECIACKFKIVDIGMKNGNK